MKLVKLIKTTFIIIAIFIAWVDVAFSSSLQEVKPITGSYLSGSYASRHNLDIEASGIFLKFIENSDSDAALLQRSYKLMLFSGEIDSSIEYAKKYTTKNKNSLSANILIALGHIKKNEFKQASKVLKRADLENDDVVSRIDSSILKLLKVWSLSGEGKNSEAILRLNDLAKKGDVPEFFYRYMLALLYEVSGDVNAAEKQYEILVKGVDILPYHFTKSIASFYKRIGKFDLAKDIYFKYISLHKSSSHFSREINESSVESNKTHQRGVLEVLQEAARVLYSSEYYSEAVGYLRLSLYLDENADEQKILLASYYQSKNKHDTAILIYKTIDDESDFYLAARIAIAENLHRSGNEAAAYKYLTRLAKSYDSDRILISLGDLLRKSKKYVRASDVYSKVLSSRAEPNKADWPIIFARGICYEQAGDWEKAEKDLQKALVMNPNQPDIMNYLGYSWIDRDMNIEQAKNMVSLAVKARPNDAQIVDSMGWVLYKMQDFTKASLFLERAAEITPNDAVINDHLGDSYWREGRFNEASFQWKKALKYRKDNDVEIIKTEDKIKNGLPDQK